MMFIQSCLVQEIDQKVTFLPKPSYGAQPSLVAQVARFLSLWALHAETWNRETDMTTQCKNKGSTLTKNKKYIANYCVQSAVSVIPPLYPRQHILH